jgi:predicted metal-binding protein
MGGSKEKDFIENLIALCRDCHDEYGDKKQYKDFLTQIHFDKMLKTATRIKLSNEIEQNQASKPPLV